MPRTSTTRAQKDAINRAKRERYWSDPAYRAKVQDYQRTYQKQRRRFDPEYAEYVRGYQREYKQSPDRRRQARLRHLRRYWGDPDYRERIRAKNRARYWRIKRDPVKYAAALERIKRWRQENVEHYRAYRKRRYRAKRRQAH